MYQPGDLTQSLLLVHRMTVDGDLQQEQTEHYRRSRDIGRNGPLAAVRRLTARGLIALGTRLDPTAGTPAAAASGLLA